MTTIAEWLRQVGLEKYVTVFEENEITVDVLPHLTESDVAALGLPLGSRRRLLVEVQRLAGAVAPPPPPPVPTRTAAPAAPAAPTTGAAAAERRQLTVMFCDLVGSTALAAQIDPEELRDLMQTYRRACGEIVARYEGHVAQYLGDGLMVYFGWPVAHEDDADRGVRSALEMVQAVGAIRAARPLAVRIGLATGPVVVGEAAGSDATEARLAVGEAPNLAARLQSLAAPNEVVIAAATRRLVGEAFALTDLGSHRLKGFDEPVAVFRADAARASQGRFESSHHGMELASLVGREEELSLLLRRWQRAVGGDGQVVSICGEAGIGKSRLSYVLRKRLAEPHTAVRYQCSPYHLNSALHPFIEQFEFAAGFTRDDTPEQRLDKLEAVLVGDIARVAEAAQLMAALLGLPTDRFPPITLSPQRRKERTLEVFVGQLEALALRDPVLVVFEDLHWVDPTSQELLDVLLPRLRRLRVLLIGTHRPEYTPKWEGQPSVTSLVLSRLERGKVAELVSEVTSGRALPPEVLEEIVAHTDGVPLFVEELTKSVLESGLLRDDGDHYTLLGPVSALAVPTSLRDSLAARLDRLGPVKEIAQIGACIGREFTHDLLSRVAALAPPQLAAALERLVDAGLISARGSAAAASYMFKHALVQDAAYDLLLRSRRQQLHARIAQVLATDFEEQVRHRPEWLAHHHTQAGDLAAAIPLWRTAGTLAIGRVALHEAVAHFQKALALTEQADASAARDRLELSIREQLNAAWAGLRGWAASEIGANTESILRLAKSTGNLESLMLGLWWMWTNTITQGRIADSLPWAERLMTEGAAADDTDLQLFGPAARMVSFFFLGRLTEAQADADRVLERYDPRSAERWIQLTGHDLRTFVGVYSCQWIWMQGHADRSVAVSETSRADARGVGHAFNLVWALTFGAYVFAYRREPERLLEQLSEVDRLAREQGLAFIERVSVPQAAGIAQLQLGHPLEAIPQLRRGIDNWVSAGGRVRLPYLKSALAEALALQGDLDAALRLVEECLEQIERPAYQERIWLSEVLRIKGSILVRAGRDDEGETALRAAVECARAQAARGWELRSATTLASFLAERGRAAEARAVLAPPCEWFTEGAGTPDVVGARALLAAPSLQS